jgi:hypothetical protein
MTLPVAFTGQIKRLMWSNGMELKQEKRKYEEHGLLYTLPGELRVKVGRFFPASPGSS